MDLFEGVARVLALKGQRRHGFDDGLNGRPRSTLRTDLVDEELREAYEQAYADGVTERMIRRGIAPR